MIKTEVLLVMAELGWLTANELDLTFDVTAKPRLTPVLDREGWSHDLFERSTKCGTAAIAGRIGKFEGDWKKSKCKPVTAPLNDLLSTVTKNPVGRGNGKQIESAIATSFIGIRSADGVGND